MWSGSDRSDFIIISGLGMNRMISLEPRTRKLYDVCILWDEDSPIRWLACAASLFQDSVRTNHQ
jgi:hypothetical protein